MILFLCSGLTQSCEGSGPRLGFLKFLSLSLSPVQPPEGTFLRCWPPTRLPEGSRFHCWTPCYLSHSAPGFPIIQPALPYLSTHQIHQHHLLCPATYLALFVPCLPALCLDFLTRGTRLVKSSLVLFFPLVILQLEFCLFVLTQYKPAYCSALTFCILFISYR